MLTITLDPTTTIDACTLGDELRADLPLLKVSTRSDARTLVLYLHGLGPEHEAAVRAVIAQHRGRPAPLLLAGLARRWTGDPAAVRWDDPAQTTEPLHPVETEAGRVTTTAYYRAGDLAFDALVEVEPVRGAVPVVETVQTWSEDGGTRSDVHRAYRPDGTYLEWAVPVARLAGAKARAARAAARVRG